MCCSFPSLHRPVSAHVPQKHLLTWGYRALQCCSGGSGSSGGACAASSAVCATVCLLQIYHGG